jgi:hypothetical protein
MDASFGVLDAFAFVVFAVLIAVAVIVVVSLGQLPGQLARKWGIRRRLPSTPRVGSGSRPAACCGRRYAHSEFFRV